MQYIDQSSHYNEISRVYDISRDANIETVEKIVESLRIDKNSTIIDLGCGTGNYTHALSKTSKKIIGIDKSIGMINEAKVKFPNLQFIYGDTMSLPFKSCIFDSAFAIQVLHHISNKEKFLKEVYRVLKKGSYFGLQSCSHKQLSAFWFCHYFSKGLEKEIKRTPDINMIEVLLEKTGFSNIGIEICYQDIVVAKETPKRYLEKNYRNGISTFGLMTEEEIELGCKRLQKDIDSGRVMDFVNKQKMKVEEIGGATIVYGQKK